METTVGFVGYECGDIAVYLAKMLSCLGKRTAVLDRTEQRSVLLMCGDEEEYAGIRLLASLEEAVRREFDVVIKVFGYQPLWEEMQECKQLFLVTDGSAYRAGLLSGAAIGGKSCCMIIRNMVSMKYAEDYLVFLAKQNVERCFLVLLDERDIRGMYCLGTEKNVPLRQLSEGMKEMLLELSLLLDDSVQRKQARQAQKKA